MIKINARERMMNVGDNKGTYRYVMMPERYSQLTVEKVVQQASQTSCINEGVLLAGYTAIGKVLADWLTEGHSLPIPGVGSIRFGLNASSVEGVKEVSTKLITSRKVILSPCAKLKSALAAANISITCIDRNGKVVENVTSKNDTVEDGTEDDETGTGGTGDSTGGGTSGDSGNSSGDDISGGY